MSVDEDAAIDSERVRGQLAYVETAVKDCPGFPSDERQRAYYRTMETMKDNFNGSMSVKMGGFPASHVNLGWLKSRAERAATDLLSTHGDHYVARVVELMIDRCVQRLRFLTVFPNPEANLIDVRFRTADDVGYYEYGFLVVLPVGWRKAFVKVDSA